AAAGALRLVHDAGRGHRGGPADDRWTHRSRSAALVRLPGSARARVVGGNVMLDQRAGSHLLRTCRTRLVAAVAAVAVVASACGATPTNTPSNSASASPAPQATSAGLADTIRFALPATQAFG